MYLILPIAVRRPSSEHASSRTDETAFCLLIQLDEVRKMSFTKKSLKARLVTRLCGDKNEKAFALPVLSRYCCQLVAGGPRRQSLRSQIRSRRTSFPAVMAGEPLHRRRSKSSAPARRLSVYSWQQMDGQN